MNEFFFSNRRGDSVDVFNGSEWTATITKGADKKYRAEVRRAGTIEFTGRDACIGFLQREYGLAMDGVGPRYIDGQQVAYLGECCGGTMRLHDGASCTGYGECDHAPAHCPVCNCRQWEEGHAEECEDPGE